jgi:plasmid stabilization system protein ParE
MAEAIISPEAQQDLLDIWDYIAEDDIDAADRVHTAAFQSFDQLAAMPQMGPLCRFKNPLLEGMRF